MYTLTVLLLVFLAILLLCSCQDTSQGTDLTETAGANGSSATLLAVARIQQSGAFGGDNDLLRRIAYVETRDGTSNDTFRDGYYGGIWAVDEEKFLMTQMTNLSSCLPIKLQQIQEFLEINWTEVTWMDLQKPIFSALAARLVLFLADRAIPPTSDLQAQAEFWVEYYNPLGDTSEFVSLSSGIEGALLESSANEFFLGFASSLIENPLELSIFVTTTEPEPVNFAVSSVGFSFTGVTNSTTSTQVAIPTTLEVQDSNDRNKGIRVKAEEDKTIVVYGLSYQDFISDAFLALPCSSLPVDEYEYFAVTYTVLTIPGFNLPALILIVACEDDTLVTTPTGLIVLQQQQTYQIESLTDLTGTRIVSTKPISVFGAQECVNIPTDVAFCDHLTEQIPPTATWGSRFLIASLLGRESGERIRVISSQGAKVTINCTAMTNNHTVYSLPNPGDWVEFEIQVNNFCSIEATSPIHVSEFASGGELDNRLGDPFVMMIPPIEQYSNNYVLQALPEFARNYLTIYVAPEHFQPDHIFVDSSSINESQWITVNCSLSEAVCGYIARVSVTSGDHWVYHEDSFARVGVSVYGFNRFNSYGYPGGLRLTPVQLVTVSFTRSTYTVSESADTLQVTITRSGATNTLVMVLVASDACKGTATAGEDYTTLKKVIEFQPGETEGEITIHILDDSRKEGGETFELYLTGGSGVHLSPFSRTEVTIPANDEYPDPPINVDAFLYGARWIDLHWTPSFDGNRPVTSVSLYIRSVDVSDNFTLIRSLNASDLMTSEGNLSYNVSDGTIIFPQTRYSFTVVSCNEIGCSDQSDPSPVVTTLRDESLLIQLRLVGVDRCQQWVVDGGRQKLDTLTAALSTNVEERCQCGFTVMNILKPTFRCFAESEDAVTYRVEIICTGVASAADITSYIQDWIKQGALITFDFVLIAVDSSCQVIVTSVLDPECNNPTETPQQSLTSKPADTQAPLALLGGVLGGVLMLVVGVLTVITAVLVCCRRYKKRPRKIEIAQDRRGKDDHEMQDNPSKQQEGEQEYEDLDAFTDLKISSVPRPYEEVKFQPPLPSRPVTSDSQEYEYITTSASQAAVSSHGDESKEFGYTDCAAYNVISK